MTNIATSISESAVSLCVKLKRNLYLDEIKGDFPWILALIEALNGGCETQGQYIISMHNLQCENLNSCISAFLIVTPVKDTTLYAIPEGVYSYAD